MKPQDLKKKYIEFFKKNNHKEIINSSLIPENDSTVLFTTAGMHPLVPYLLGEKHPSGKRLVNNQKCLRTGDIEEVGDDIHLTFFEMLGNWSLGDYWKEESIKYSYDFLTDKKWLGLDKNRLAVSVFKGDKDAPKDKESYDTWIKLGIPKERIFFLGKKDNWWGPTGLTGPCGPDTEIFYYVGEKVPKKFDVKDSNWVEIWNNVFMEYNKNSKGKYTELKQKNVDTGFGYERVYAILEGKNNVYDSSLFLPIVEEVRKLSKDKDEKSIRKIVDHLKASVFLLSEGITPSNVDRGYVLRRLIRTSIRHGWLLKIKNDFCKDVSKVIIDTYKKDYPILEKKKKFIFKELEKEEVKFKNTLEKGLNKFERFAKNKKISGKEAFLLFQSFGFPIEMTMELSKEKKVKVDIKGYENELKKHQELSRTATKGRFSSGLADSSEKTTKLHTATHLLNEALRKILKKDIYQRGSNITSERARFDFNFDRKLTDDEIKKIEDLVNRWIKEGLEVKKEIMTLEEARKKGAKGIFEEKYGNRISVYFVGEVSKEICAGPHVNNIKNLGKFKIIKQQSVGAGVRRIKAVLR